MQTRETWVATFIFLDEGTATTGSSTQTSKINKTITVATVTVTYVPEEITLYPTLHNKQHYIFPKQH